MCKSYRGSNGALGATTPRVWDRPTETCDARLLVNRAGNERERKDGKKRRKGEGALPVAIRKSTPNIAMQRRTHRGAKL